MKKEEIKIKLSTAILIVTLIIVIAFLSIINIVINVKNRKEAEKFNKILEYNELISTYEAKETIEYMYEVMEELQSISFDYFEIDNNYNEEAMGYEILNYNEVTSEYMTNEFKEGYFKAKNTLLKFIGEKVYLLEGGLGFSQNGGITVSNINVSENELSAVITMKIVDMEENEIGYAEDKIELIKEDETWKVSKCPFENDFENWELIVWKNN